MDSRRATILLTGAGSGVGQSVLQALAGRRSELRIIGGDSDPNTSAFRDTDDAVVLPLTADPGYAEAVHDACVGFGVDLVIPGRDPDVELLSGVAEEAGWPSPVVGAPHALVAMTRDKWATFEWCRARGIPFAESVPTGRAESSHHASQLAARWGLPLVCKPRSGSGSAGVRLILDESQLDAALMQPGMLLQPFLSPPPSDALRWDTDAGVPLFWEIPCHDEPAIMALIGPCGEIGPHIRFTATHRLGRVENLHRISEPELETFATRVIRSFRDGGWRGPLNLQVRRGPDGWHIIEANPRFTGGTAGRLHLGLDEVGWIVNRWLDADVIPKWPHPPVSAVERRLTEVPVYAS